MARMSAAERQAERQRASSVEEFVDGLKQQYLWCRTWGHSWQPYTVHTVRDVEGAPRAFYEQTLRCKCKVKRYILLSQDGTPLRKRHDYTDAPGYLSMGVGRIVGKDRDMLRLTLVHRLIRDEEAA